MYSRSKQRWHDSNLPTLKLYFAPRFEKYAESYDEYCLRREIYKNFDLELPREMALKPDWAEIDNYLSKLNVYNSENLKLYLK